MSDQIVLKKDGCGQLPTPASQNLSIFMLILYKICSKWEEEDGGRGHERRRRTGTGDGVRGGGGGWGPWGWEGEEEGRAEEVDGAHGGWEEEEGRAEEEEDGGRPDGRRRRDSHGGLSRPSGGCSQHGFNPETGSPLLASRHHDNDDAESEVLPLEDLHLLAAEGRLVKDA